MQLETYTPKATKGFCPNLNMTNEQMTFILRTSINKNPFNILSSEIPKSLVYLSISLNKRYAYDSYLENSGLNARSQCTVVCFFNMHLYL